MDNEEIVEPWEDALETAEEYALGYGSHGQDNHKAIKYYLKAIELGYIQGYADIAMIYNLEFDDTEKSFEYYKKGAAKGCTSCYAGIGQYYYHTDSNRSLRNYELYMKNTPIDELIYVHICQYLVLSIKSIVIDRIQDDIKYFEKTLAYKDEIFDNYSTGAHFISHDYDSFYDLPKQVQEELLLEYEKYDSNGYVTASYRGQFNLGEDFLYFIKLIYTDGYISPNDFDGMLFKNNFMEIF